MKKVDIKYKDVLISQSIQLQQEHNIITNTSKSITKINSHGFAQVIKANFNKAYHLLYGK